MFASLSQKSRDDISHFKKENKVQLMALVIPFTFLFGFDGSPFRAIDPSTNTHEQDVSEYGCLTE